MQLKLSKKEKLNIEEHIKKNPRTKKRILNIHESRNKDPYGGKRHSKVQKSTENKMVPTYIKERSPLPAKKSFH